MFFLLIGVFPSMVFSFTGPLQSQHNIRSLPCLFIDEQVSNVTGKLETESRRKNAVLQFGQEGDRPVQPNEITFVINSNAHVDMRRFAEGVKDTLQCDIRRYSTDGDHVHWPGLGVQEHDMWFTCTLSHKEGLSITTTLLRHTPTIKPSTKPKKDFMAWLPLGDTDVLITTAVMVVSTITPMVETRLKRRPKLKCRFAVYPNMPDLTVEWHLLRPGVYIKPSKYSKFMKQKSVSAYRVSSKAIAAGVASISLPLTNRSSEGTYACRVSIQPLSVACNIILKIMEPPDVSIDVGSSLTLMEREPQRVVCKAKDYYPLDVKIQWFQEFGNDSGMHEVQEKYVHVYGHQENQDGTFSLSSSVKLLPGLRASGHKYTCSVSHKSLLMPILKSFTLTVLEDMSMWMTVWPYFSMLTFVVMLRQFLSVGKPFPRSYRTLLSVFLFTFTILTVIYIQWIKH